MMNKITAIILAAGKGTRFKSERPKVLHEFNGKPMIHHVIESVQDAQIKSICLVVGYKKDDVKEACKSFSATYTTRLKTSEFFLTNISFSSVKEKSDFTSSIQSLASFLSASDGITLKTTYSIDLEADC